MFRIALFDPLLISCCKARAVPVILLTSKACDYLVPELLFGYSGGQNHCNYLSTKLRSECSALHLFDLLLSSCCKARTVPVILLTSEACGYLVPELLFGYSGGQNHCNYPSTKL